MAGQENQGDLWVLSSGLDLQLSNCVCWRQDTDPCLCAKHGEQRRMFNGISSRSSMNQRIVKHVSEIRFYIFKMIKLRVRCLIGLLT